MDLPPVNLDNNTDVTSTAVASDIDAKTGPVLSHQYLDDHMPGSFDDPDMRDMYAYLGHAAMKAAFEAIKERLDNGGVATEAERVTIDVDVHSATGRDKEGVEYACAIICVGSNCSHKARPHRA